VDCHKNGGNSLIWVFLEGVQAWITAVKGHRLSSTSSPGMNARPTPVGEITLVSTNLGWYKKVLALLFHTSFEVHLNSKIKPTY